MSDTPMAFPLPQQRIAHCSSLAIPGVRVAVVVHVFYSDLIPEIQCLLKHIVEPFDVIITTPHETGMAEMVAAFSPLAAGMAVVLSENRGRDIGPFMGVHRQHMLDGYDAILKLHSKKSLYDPGRGAQWREDVFQRLCGDSKTTRRSIALLREGKAGLVGPHGYHTTHAPQWGGNRQRVHQLLQPLLPTPLAESTIALSFFAGSMFWYAPSALSALHAIPDDLLGFETEQGQQDATLAHALERLFGLLPSLSGKCIASLHPAGPGFEVMYHDQPW